MVGKNEKTLHLRRFIFQENFSITSQINLEVKLQSFAFRVLFEQLHYPKSFKIQFSSVFLSDKSVFFFLISSLLPSLSNLILDGKSGLFAFQTSFSSQKLCIFRKTKNYMKVIKRQYILNSPEIIFEIHGRLKVTIISTKT